MIESNARQRCAGAIAGACLLWTGVAGANPMDFATERLGVCSDGSAPNPSGATATAPFPCPKTTASPQGSYMIPDNAAWAKLVAQYAVAIAPPPMMPARTTGYGGFELSLFGTVTTIANSESYFQRGTQGAIGTVQGASAFPSQNSSVDPVLQLYGIRGRKGLPYGFELQVSVAYMADTEMTALGGGFRWAVFEGFRKGMSQYIPDVSIGGSVNTLTGSNEVKVTVPTLDVQVSKPFVVANRIVLQPYLGYQVAWLLADSGVVDGTPNLSVVDNCNARPPSPSEITGKTGDNGDLHCQPKPGTPGSNSALPARLDLNNDMVFQPLRVRVSRLAAGLSVRYEAVHFVAHLATSLADPSGTNDSFLAGMPHQLTFGFETGVSW